MDPFLTGPAKVAALRALLPATSAGIHLDTATAGPFPVETDRALREWDDRELRVGRSGRDRADELRQRDAEARAVVAAVLSADLDDVVLGPGAAGLLLRAGLALPIVRPGPVVTVDGLADEVAGAARAVAAVRRRGFAVEGDAAGAARMDPALIVAPVVSARDGALVDVDPLERARTSGARVVLDASLGVGAIRLPASEQGADVLVAETRHWLLGPEGAAVAWIAPHLRDDVLSPIAATIDPLPPRTLLGIGRSVGWLLMHVGLPWLTERAQWLGRELAGQLGAIPGVELLTPIDRMAATVAFRIRGWTADEAADELGQRVFAIVSRLPALGTVRASVGAWTTEEEIGRFTRAISVMAGHTPETLPRRPSLVILDERALR
jgi:selenocysteine lyase/cysteine desulfurase